MSLSPKDCALLYHLAANAGRVVTHAKLLRAGWGATSVGPDLLKVGIAGIRRLLGDTIDAPRLIANVHGEGYRFIPPRDRLLDAPEEAALSHSVVGREQELSALAEALSDATAGVRQMLFITGEAGIGKTAVIDEFVGRTGARARIGRGQCIEHYGRGEPYLPVTLTLAKRMGILRPVRAAFRTIVALRIALSVRRNLLFECLALHHQLAILGRSD